VTCFDNNCEDEGEEKVEEEVATYYDAEEEVAEYNDA